jgi:ankyrin repeat protein
MATMEQDPLILTFLKNEAKVSASSQALKLLYEKRYWARDFSQRVARRVTGLHLAAYLGLKEGMIALIDGYDPDIQNTHKRTPLSWAAESGQREVVELLLEKGANPTSKDYSGQTSLHYAAKAGHNAVVSLLLAQGNVHPENDGDYDTPPLCLAVQGGHEGVVKELLADGRVDPDYRDSWSRTLLSWAAQLGARDGR